MSQPHQVLIEFYATRYPDEARVLAQLRALNLPPPPPGVLTRIRNRILEKAPHDIRSFLKGGALPTLDILWSWAHRQPYGAMWAREPVFVDYPFADRGDFEAAWDLLAIDAHRNVLDALLVQDARFRGQKRGELFEVMKARFEIGISERTLDLYSRYFFNMKRVQRTDWIHYLCHCDTTRKEMLLLAGQTDDEARLRHRLGAVPSFSYPQVLADVAATSYFKFKDHADDASPSKAQSWAKILMEAGDRREKFKAQDTKDLRRDLQLEFEYLEMQMPSLEDIESGAFDEAVARFKKNEGQ